MISCLTQRIELNYLIPAIRKELIVTLEQNGLNDTEIAKKLGITKSAVSQYKHKKRGKTLNFPLEIKNKIKKSAKEILMGKSADSEINFLINEMKKSKFICCVCKVCKC